MDFPGCDDERISDQMRADAFIRELQATAAKPGDQCSNLLVMSLPNRQSLGGGSRGRHRHERRRAQQPDSVVLGEGQRAVPQRAVSATPTPVFADELARLAPRPTVSPVGRFASGGTSAASGQWGNPSRAGAPVAVRTCRCTNFRFHSKAPRARFTRGFCRFIPVGAGGLRLSGQF